MRLLRCARNDIMCEKVDYRHCEESAFGGRRGNLI